MKSKTKNLQKPDVILQLTRRAFGNSTDVVEAKEINSGYFNAVYTVKLSDGRETVLKISPDKKAPVLRLERKAMLTEVQVIRLLRENTRIPVPEVFYYDDTYERFDFEYLFMEKLEGQDFSTLESRLSANSVTHIVKQLGTFAREMHALCGSHFGYFLHEMGWRSTWAEAFHMMVSDVLKDGVDKRVLLPVSYSEVEKVIDSCSYLLDDVKVARLIHWDLWHNNVLVENDEITGIIDVERAIWGDPVMETYFIGFYNTSSFCEGYGLNPISGAKNYARRELYNLHFYLMAIISNAYRGGGDPDGDKAMREMVKPTIDTLIRMI